ncbi:protein phosphatase methylesterase 1 [Drepanopeziza brunnea f. sp. 'multigermtubi' MB_m1]|uniref:Protein phosphatase methylesterase 1 n=2 Tax=Drepanopeziza brunnea f. sp. 'multigermtubi' TaxID=698441 RepID=K1X6J6_MARBU|nr:protein phosphatase methylesterase 1 [Drepanopeziza brunnea f. sp. 'multigermtubi' MB_m1]EKD20711.1 protein phosphatase methylesterase 1 [Drepanopeziza brunnea f. sp. 'multigermtubi' MB_m1]
MSGLQRSFAKAKLASYPATMPPLSQDVDEPEEEPDQFDTELAQDDDSSSASSASSASSTGTIIPSQNQKLFARPKGSPNKRTMDQIPWTSYFERELFLESTTETFTIMHHAYLTSPIGNAPLFVTHHGAGSSGLSFALLTAEIRKCLPNAGILSLDARGHGSTTTTPDPEIIDLSLETLSADLIAILDKTKKRMAWKQLPPMILIGHSLGGAVVTNVAKSGELGDAVLGYAVLDVVEGSAIDALQSMQTYLSTRPAGFPSLELGIEWHIRSRTIRNSMSARTSVPALLKHDPKVRSSRSWTWKTDLAATQPFWEGWFVGLSKKFLEAKGGKLLLLAGTDRLDKELIIGQMQGKYSLQVFPEAGHFIHEDLPEKTAMVIVDFYRRNDRSALVLPPKVSDMLRAGMKVKLVSWEDPKIVTENALPNHDLGHQDPVVRKPDWWIDLPASLVYKAGRRDP